MAAATGSEVWPAPHLREVRGSGEECRSPLDEDGAAVVAAATSGWQQFSLSPSLSASPSPSSPSLSFARCRSPSSPPGCARRVLVELSARHLPSGLDPLACLLLRPTSDAVSGEEQLLGHTEVVRSSVDPTWQRRLVLELHERRGQTVRIALFDAAQAGEAQQPASHSQPRQQQQPALPAARQAARPRGDSGGGSSSADMRRSSSSSLLDRLSLRRRLSASVFRSGPEPASSSSSSLSRVELRSEDAIGSALLPLDDLCHAQRFHVQQRLPLRHTFDSDIDRRLQRLNAHLLVTVRPDSTRQQRAQAAAGQSEHVSPPPRLSAVPGDACGNGPSCALPFDSAYRLLCRGAEMWKLSGTQRSSNFLFLSASARPQRRVVFYARHPLSAAQLQRSLSSNPSTGDWSADESSAPNPLFPLGLLYWCAPGKRVCDSARCVPLHSITALYERCQTAAFASVLRERDRHAHRTIRPPASRPRQAQADSLPLELGFSVVSPQRTLDLIPDSQHVRDVFLTAIHGILMQHERICYEDSREDWAEEAKRTEERRQHNERQLAGQVAVSFSLTHLPLPSAPSTAVSVDTQIRILLSKQMTVDTAGSESAPTEHARSVPVGSTEWVEVDEVVAFAHIFTLTLPTALHHSSAEQYHLSVVDLSHRTLGTATFSALLLSHHHIDIPLSLRHSNHSVDSLLSFNRTCAAMRVTPLTARDTLKADLLDVITLLQAQPTAPVDLPYITLAFMLRGEMCDYYHAPSFSAQRTTLQYNHDTRSLQLAGHSLPLPSLVDVHRQLKAASELTESMCAAHPEKRVNSRRVMVVHTSDSGSFVCQMRSVMAADAWVTGIRQLMSAIEDGGRAMARGRADMEHEQLNWANFDISAHDTLQHGDGDSDSEFDGAADSPLWEQPYSPVTSVAAAETSPFGSPLVAAQASGDAWEESELRVAAPHPTFLTFSSLLNGLPPLHSRPADDVEDEDEDGSVATGDGEEELGAPRLSAVDMSDGHLISRSYRPARRLSHSSGLRSPFVHSRSFSSLQQPGFHLTPPLSPNQQHDDAREEEVNSEPVLVPDDVAIPAAPSMLGLDSDIPCAPPMDVPPAPPMSDDGLTQPAVATANKLRKLHWDTLGGEAEARGTIFESLDTQLDQTTVEAIEKLFAAVVPQQRSEEEPVVRAVELIDRRRAQNVSIALRGLKTSADDIIRAILECDLQLLSVERLQQLIACLPDAVEAKQIKAYSGAAERLGPAEHFMLAVTAIPRCAVRLQLLLLAATFEDAVSQLSAHCHTMTDACEAVRSSDRLAAAMQGVLAVGGLMSGKRAAGFKLSSLDKLHALKSQQQQHAQFSLLDFIVEREVSRAQADELIPPRADRLFFESLDVGKLHSAAKLDWQAVQTDIQTLQEQLRAARREMDRAEQGTQQSLSRAHSRSQSQLQAPEQPSSSPSAAVGQVALHRALKSFLPTGLSAFHRLSSLHASTSDTLRRTQRYFAESDGAPQSLFASLARFIVNFTASERRYWDKLDKQQRKAAIAMRKQHLLEAGQQLPLANGSSSKRMAEDGQHFSYVEAKRSDEVEADQRMEQSDSSRTLDTRFSYDSHTNTRPTARY